MSVKYASAKSRDRKDSIVLTDEEIVEKEPSGSFAWKALLPSQIRTLSQCEAPEDLEEKTAIIMDLVDHKVDLQQACKLDCFVIAFNWAKEKGFDDRQLSGFMTLVWNMLDNIKDRHMSKADNILYLKECFSGVGSENPDVVPIPLYFFKLEHAKLIMHYLLTTFMQHYALYEFLFKHGQDELIIGSDLCTEVCPEMTGPFPSPLQEAVPAEIHEEFSVQHEKKKEEEIHEMKAVDSTEEITEAVLQAVESSKEEIVKTVSTAELRNIIGKVVKEMIIPAKTEFESKIKNKEAVYLARIGKIEAK